MTQMVLSLNETKINLERIPRSLANVGDLLYLPEAMVVLNSSGKGIDDPFKMYDPRFKMLSIKEPVFALVVGKHTQKRKQWLEVMHGEEIVLIVSSDVWRKV